MEQIEQTHAKEGEVAVALAISAITLQRWRKTGYGPPWIRVGKAIWYPRAGVSDWLNNQTPQGDPNVEPIHAR
jgi:predicted site-specific integrase-resolvase